MSFTPLAARFATIEQTCNAETVQFGNEVTLCQRQRTALEAELREVQQRLEVVRTRERELQEAATAQEKQHISAYLQVATDGLRENFTELLRSHPYWIELALLEQQRDQLLKQDPALPLRIEGYRKVEANTEHYLATLPEDFRPAIAHALCAEKERILVQIAPFLAVEEKLGALRLEQPLPVQVLVSYQEEHEHIHWVFPFPADPATLAQHGGAALFGLIELLLTTLGSFSKHPGWFVDDLEVHNWEGYTAVTMLAHSRLPEPIEHSAERLFHDLLGGSALLNGVTLNLQVSRLWYAAWHEGRRDVSLSPDAGAPSEPEEGLSIADQPLLSETSQGWYTDADVRAWSRVKESRLSQQARRLRTLLIRLIGRGIVGGEAVPVEELWSPLPPYHAEEMRQGITELLRAGVLLPGAGDTVSIHAAMLPEIQNLINREPGAFWNTLTEGTARG